MTKTQKKLSTMVSATISELKLLRSSFLHRGEREKVYKENISFRKEIFPTHLVKP